jgi:putative flippase GtrA
MWNPLQLVATAWQNCFVRFLIVGAINTAFGYAVFGGMLWLGCQRTVALLLATIAGVLFNFRTVGVAVFRNPEPRLFLRFVAGYSVVFAVNATLLEGLVRGLEWSPMVAQAASLPVMAVVGFLTMRTLVFQSRTVATPAEETHVLSFERQMTAGERSISRKNAA